MKTFPEFFQDSIDMTDGSVTMTEKDYKAIQLDAIKEGMRRASRIVSDEPTLEVARYNITQHLRDAILTAAEKVEL